MIKKLLLIMLMLLSQTSFAGNKLNRLYGYFSGWPYPPMMQYGLAYDRVFTARWASGVNLNSDVLSFFHSGSEGFGAELMGRLFLWGHSKNWFEKGFIISLGIGLNRTKYEYGESHDRKSEYEWQIPLTLSVSYIYTFDIGLFFEVGAKAKLAYLEIPERAGSISLASLYPIPKPYVSLGWAFNRLFCN